MTPFKTRVLIVEDEQEILQILTSQVDYSLWEVTTASGVKDALKKLETLTFDLVITDFHMPDGKGERVATAARSVGINKVFLHSSDPSHQGDPLYSRFFDKLDRELVQVLKGKVAA